MNEDEAGRFIWGVPDRFEKNFRIVVTLMKIGIDIRCLADGRKTGVEEYASQLLENIFMRDRENDYILFLNAYKKTYIDLDWVGKYPNVSVRYFRWPNKILNFCFWYLRWPKADKMIGGVDIFFMPNMNFIAVSTDTKLFVTAHDLSFERYPETFSIKRRLWHSFVNFRDLCKRAHHIFAVSESTRSDLLELYRIPEKKVTTILSGVSHRFSVMDRNSQEILAVKEKYKLPYKYILYLGTVEPRKNIVSVIRAYNRLQQNGDAELAKYSLVIAGARGWEYDEIFKEIGQSKWKDRIIVTDFVEDEDKPAIYNLANLFIYPSFFEGFGLPPIEAMRCGVPVIVSMTSSFPEVIANAGIMVDPNQPEELFYAMREVLMDKDLQETLKKRGLERSLKFSWQQTAHDVLKRWREA